jgi:hypothetical protein
MRPRRALLLLACVAAVAGGCAWSNRANRPVWNAFEKHLVPETDGAFYASLPLTVPAGLVSILADTFVVHPVQVMDDAWGDAGEIWDDIEWEHEYYTELALLPFRVVGTPIVFVVTFLGRSMFDVPPHGVDESAPDEVAGTVRTAQYRALELLKGAALRRDDDLTLRAAFRKLDWPEWTAELDVAWERAVTEASAAVRSELFRLAQDHKLPPWRADPFRGLRDPSAVVRYFQLRGLPESSDVPDELAATLLHDPEVAVRELAQSRWPSKD